MNPKPVDFLAQAYFAFAKGADTPVSLSCWLMFKYGEHSQLARKDIDPLLYNDVAKFRKDYAVVKYLSKYKGLNTGIDLDEAALSSWKAAEAKCLETNMRLKNGRLRGFPPRVERIFHYARRKIAAVLGPCSYSKAFAHCKWGPGATFSLKGENATLGHKIGEIPISVTPKALGIVKAVIESDPHWFQAMLGIDVDGPFSCLPQTFKKVHGCRATLVDKNAKTKRSIAIEPTGNIFLQLGIGRYIRRRLKHFGVDLDDQTPNQRLAKEGSLTGLLATIDLSAASDTVSTELVYELLPLDWVLLLDLVRSPNILWGSNWVKCEKFSSMGNGFTFELESLLFFAIADAVVKDELGCGTVGVYGDDIVVDSSVYLQLREVLEYAGFSVNTEKSYYSGYFRESCGKHYWRGIDVTPPYQKELIDSLPEAYRFSNRLLRYAYRRDELRFAYLADWCRAAWATSLNSAVYYRRGQKSFLLSRSDSVTDKVAKSGLHFVPFGDDSDDGVLLPIRQFEAVAITKKWEHGVVRFQCPVLSFRPRKVLFPGLSQLAYLMRFGSESPFNGRVAVRRRGKWIGRRRWLSPYLFTPRSTLDVGWEALD